MDEEARAAVKAMNWLALAYTAETAAIAATTAPRPLAVLVSIAAAIVLLKSARVAGRAARGLGWLAGTAATVMAAVAVLHAPAALIDIDTIESLATVFLAGVAAYCYAAYKQLKSTSTLDKRAADGAAMAAAGAALGAVATTPPGLTVGLLIYLAGLHNVMKSIVEAMDATKAGKAEAAHRESTAETKELRGQ